MATAISSSPSTSEYLLTGNMMALKDALQVYANNVTNAGTTGFKQDLFKYSAYGASVGAEDSTIFGVADNLFRDPAQGEFSVTGNPFDVAISGDAYLSVNGPNGVAYTRAGAFSMNAEGFLVDGSGYTVLDAGGGEIAPPNDMVISPDGTISDALGQQVAQLGLFQFEDQNALKKIGDNLYESVAEALPAEGVEVYQGYLENSNVNVPVTMALMQDAMTAYQQEASLLKMNFQAQLDITSQLVLTA